MSNKENLQTSESWIRFRPIVITLPDEQNGAPTPLLLLGTDIVVEALHVVAALGPSWRYTILREMAEDSP